MKRHLAHIATALLTTTLCALCHSGTAWALTTGHFAKSSLLAQGRWVKIAVSETGVTQITAQELSAMGFGSPESVRVFGQGGNMMSEVLSESQPDDLQQVPTLVINGKLCFWARGPVAVSATGTATSTPRFTRTVNAYSTQGYYFLTQDAGTALTISQAQSGATGTVARATSLDYALHEQELRSASETGKDLLGEIIDPDNGATFSFTLPERVPGTAIVANPRVAATSSDSVFVVASIGMGSNSYPLEFGRKASGIMAVNASRKTYIYYYATSPVATVTPDSTITSDDGTLKLSICDPDKSLSASYLDHFMLTYTRRNKLAQGQSQMRLGVANPTTYDRIVVADSGLVVWDIDNPQAPERHTLEPDSTGGWSFSPHISGQWAQFVAFNPADTLLSIASWAEVANQNLHADTVPDLVIVTSKAFLDQAERIAHMHRQNDRMLVNVYDQDQIFNEFSSGTPDPMAIRLMNKMFYDRDTKGRFRYCLILGCGSYDNRGITTDKANRVITYQTDASNDETTSYVCDDFFGMLDDNSGSILSSDQLRLGMGRIPSADEAECKSDVDKLLSYVNNPDYGVWRNNVFVAADQGDNNMHRFQAEGIAEIINTDYGSGMTVSRDYIGMYPMATDLAEPNTASSERTATMGRDFMTQQLKTGQMLATFVGHADPTSLTHDNHLWTIRDAQSTTYSHQPIMCLATCDVARFDSDTRGIAEIMFHKADGGAIALVAAARTVFANSNDKLNRAFFQALYQNSRAGDDVLRLGDAYKQCKLTFGKVSDHSKMSYILLGDPAMRVDIPKSLMRVTKVNGTDVLTNPSTQVATTPMHEITIEAQVYDKNDTAYVDRFFNGRATISLYDRAEYYNTVTGTVNNRSTTRTIYYPRNLLAQVTDTVIGGVLRTTLLVPRFVKAWNHECRISVYAHKTGTSQLVSGEWDHLMVQYYQSSGAVTDTEAPVIEKMYLDSEAACADGAPMPSNPTLHIQATDDHALSTQQNNAGMGMTLTLDGGATTYNEVSARALVTDGGKAMTLSFPLGTLASGEHTLTFTVPDAAGNQASRTINFSVMPDAAIELATQEGDVAQSQATFTITPKTELSGEPTVTVRVIDAAGRLVWHKTASTFPITWNLTSGRSGRVPAGAYHYSATYTTAGGQSGGTRSQRLIVIDPHK